MYGIFLVLFANIGLIGLTGCSVLPSTPLPHSPAIESRWEIQQQRVRDNVIDWAITGRIGIQKEEQGWYAALRWDQHRDHYRLQVSGPAGQGAARLEGGPEGVVLRQGNGTTDWADSPEQLLETHLGWQLPVAGLRDWVRGLPTVGEFTGLELDDQGRLTGLHQNGWALTLSHYQTVSGIDLPGRVELEHSPIHIKLAIERWQIVPVKN